MTLKDIMTAKQAAQFLGVHPNTIYLAAERKQIPHRRLGRKLLFSRSVIMEWFERGTTARKAS